MTALVSLPSMEVQKNKAYVDEMFAELIPFFLQNRHGEIPEMEASLDKRDFNSLARMGHKLYGCSKTYGFLHLGDLAVELEDAARVSDVEKLKATIDSIRAHLDRVDIVFVNALDQNFEVSQ